MSVYHDFIPRFDGALSTPLTAVGLDQLGGVVERRDGLVEFGNLGVALCRDAIARPALERMFAKKWDIDRHDEAGMRRVRDAAADFKTSTLEKVLSPGEDIVLNEDKPYIFVPRPNRPLALRSRNLLEPGWRTNSYKIKVRTGQAQWLEPHAISKLEFAGFKEEKKLNGAEYYGIKYGVTIPRTWEDRITGTDSLNENQLGAVEALDDWRERVSGFGDGSKNLPGMFTLGDALIGNGGQEFKSGNVDAVNMMRRLAAFNRLYFRTNRERQANRLIAPFTDKDAMDNTYFGDTNGSGNGDSVWDRAVKKYPWLANAVWTDRLTKANALGNASRWAIYSDNPNELYIEHTESLIFGPFEEGMLTYFVVLRRHGGVVNRRPERVLYIDFTP